MPRGTDVAGAVVVLTGASSGIARATAVQLAGRGARLVLAARDPATLQGAARDCRERGAEVLAVPTDVSDHDAVVSLAQQACKHFGRIDVWVNAAAVIAYGHFEKTPWPVYRQVLETNLFGQLHGARAALKHFREQDAGILINVSSVWGTVTSPYVSAYVTSKYAVRAFSDCLQEGLRLERGAKNIHVCTILPQSVDTPIFEHAANYTGEAIKPVGPVIKPDRAAGAIIACIERPRRQRVVGSWGRTLEISNRIFPDLFARLVPRSMQLLGLRRSTACDTDGNVFTPQPELNGIHGHGRHRGHRNRARVAVGGAAAASAAALVSARQLQRAGARR